MLQVSSTRSFAAPSKKTTSSFGGFDDDDLFSGMGMGMPKGGASKKNASAPSTTNNVDDLEAELAAQLAEMLGETAPAAADPANVQDTKKQADPYTSRSASLKGALDSFSPRPGRRRAATTGGVSAQINKPKGKLVSPWHRTLLRSTLSQRTARAPFLCDKLASWRCHSRQSFIV